MDKNGAAYSEKDEKSIPQDMKKLLASVNGILDVLGKRAFSDNGGNEVPSDPKVEDIKKYANNLGVAVPAGFILIHNDFQKIFDIINGFGLGSDEKSSSGSVGDVVLKGIGVVSAVSMAIEDLATSAKFAGTTLEVTLPDSFKTLLAEMGLVSYFHEAGYEIDLDSKGQVTGITRKSKDQILEYVDAAKDVMETVKDFYTVTHSGLATKIAGIATAVADGIEDLAVSYKFAETLVTTELPESFATLLAEIGMMSYFDEAGFVVDLNPDGSVKSIERKELSESDKVVSLIDTGLEKAKDVAGAFLTGGFTVAFEAIANSLGSAIEKIGKSMKFAETVKEAKIPDNFATILAETQLIDYMTEAGYDLEIDKNGEVTKLEYVGDKKTFLESLGSVFSNAAGFFGGLAGNFLGGISDAFADSNIKEDMGMKINEKLIERYSDAFAQITDTGLDIKDLQNDYTTTITTYFDAIKDYVEDEKDDISEDLVVLLNPVFAQAINRRLTAVSSSSKDNQSIQTAFDNLANKYSEIDFTFTDKDISSIRTTYKNVLTTYFNNITNSINTNRTYASKMIDTLNDLIAKSIGENLSIGNTDNSSIQSVVATLDDKDILDKLNTVIQKLERIRSYTSDIKDKNMSVTVNVPPSTTNTNISDNDTP